MRGPPSPPTVRSDADLKTLGVSLGVSRKIRMTMKLDTKIRETRDLRPQVRRLFFSRPRICSRELFCATRLDVTGWQVESAGGIYPISTSPCDEKREIGKDVSDLSHV